jgi:tetratricopeptide (TPR) repeat protein
VQRRPARAAGIALAVAVLGVLPIALLVQEHGARLAIEEEATRARAAEREARRDAATAQRIVGFLQGVFRQNRPEEDLGRDVGVRELLDRSLASIRAELQDEPEVRAALLDAMGGAYHGLGEGRLAAEVLEESLRLREGVLRQRGTDLHQTLADLAAARHANEDYAGAEALLRRMLAELPPVGGPGGAAAVATALSLSGTLIARQQFDEAQRLLDEVVATCGRELPPESLPLGEALARRSRLKAQRFGEDAAIADQDAALAILRQRLPPSHPRLLRMLIDVATRERNDRRSPAAEALLVEAEASAAKVYSADHPRLAEVRQHLALVRVAQGRHDEARQLLAASEAALRRAQPPPSLAFARHLTHAGVVARHVGDVDGALEHVRAASRMFVEVMPAGSLNECVALDQMLPMLLAKGRGGEAVADARRLLELRERLDRGDRVPRCASAITAVRVAHAGRDRELVQAASAAALRLLPEAADARLANNTFAWFGDWLVRQRRFADGARVLARHAAAFPGGKEEGTDRHARALLELGTACHLDQRNADALEVLQRAHAIVRALPQPAADLRARVPEWVGFVLEQLDRVDEALPFVEAALAAARAMDSKGEVQSATISLAQIRRKLGEPAAAIALLWPVIDELAAAGKPDSQAVRVVNLMIDLQDGETDATARAAAFERLRAAANVLLPPDHKTRKKLEQRAARG